MNILLNPGILWLSIITSTASWAFILYLNWDWIQSGGYKRIFTVLAGVHLFRFIGLAALSTEHVGPELGLPFSYLMQVAFGDWAANVLAIAAILAVRKDWTSATFWSWAFIVVGTLDTLNAGPNFALAIKDQNEVSAMGWLILTVYVPVIAITEGMILWQLVKRWRAPRLVNAAS
jgi:hypothetical protein